MKRNDHSADWSTTLTAYYTKTGRIIRLHSDHPHSGRMTDLWYRDEGRRYLGQILRETGRSLVPEPLIKK